jgi:hypothetical protein
MDRLQLQKQLLKRQGKKLTLPFFTKQRISMKHQIDLGG